MTGRKVLLQVRGRLEAVEASYTVHGSKLWAGAIDYSSIASLE